MALKLTRHPPYSVSRVTIIGAAWTAYCAYFDSIPTIIPIKYPKIAIIENATSSFYYINVPYMNQFEKVGYNPTIKNTIVVVIHVGMRMQGI